MNVPLPLEPESTVLVTGAGVDGLFEGSEHELGTPTIDAGRER